MVWRAKRAAGGGTSERSELTAGGLAVAAEGSGLRSRVIIGQNLRLAWIKNCKLSKRIKVGQTEKLRSRQKLRIGEIEKLDKIEKLVRIENWTKLKLNIIENWTKLKIRQN